MNASKRCKNCGDIYEVHVQYILDWDGDHQIHPDEDECARFQPMDNLELLEWEYKQSLLNVPTSDNLK